MPCSQYPHMYSVYNIFNSAVSSVLYIQYRTHMNKYLKKMSHVDLSVLQI